MKNERRLSPARRRHPRTLRVELEDQLTAHTIEGATTDAEIVALTLALLRRQVRERLILISADERIAERDAAS